MKQEPTAIGTKLNYIAIYNGDLFDPPHFISKGWDLNKGIIICFPIGKDFNEAWEVFEDCIHKTYPEDAIENLLANTSIYRVIE